MKLRKAKKKEQMHIPKTIEESIPYEAVYKDGIMEVRPGVFSKSYLLPEANFKTASTQNQWRIAGGYSEFISSLPQGTTAEITIYNKTIDIMQFQDKVLIKMAGDGLDGYRSEYNQMLVKNLSVAKNNLESIKILTLTIEDEDPLKAYERFGQMDHTVDEGIKSITQHPAEPMDTVDRLELLNSIYNQDSVVPLCQKRIYDGYESESFSLENLANQGITTKDLIAPSGMEFKSSDFMIGNMYARCYYISNYPTWLKASMMSDLSSLPANMIVSAYFNAIPDDEAIKLIRNQRTNIAAAILETQKKASRSGYDPSLISPDTQDAKEEAKELIDGLSKDNNRLFVTNIVITVFAATMEELGQFEKELKTLAAKCLVTIKPLSMQQEQGFNSSLPIGNNQLEIQRLMTSNSIGAIIPFNVREINQPTGIYYGLNAASRNMIFFDRKHSLFNPNGCILGMPGAGKSFSAKREIINVLLANPNDEVYVIDPEGIDYAPLARAFGGAEIKLAAGSNYRLNPFDLNLKNAEENENPVKLKTGFIQTICDIMIGGKLGLSPMDLSIIDKCATSIYDDYVNYLKMTGKDIDTEHAPTLLDFYNELMMMPSQDAQTLALSLERYVKGGLDIFSGHTNMEINNRFTVFNIRDIGPGLKELGLQICFDHIWNKMIQNKAEGKSTWIYIDEFYLMMNTQTSASYIAQIWKRARKWNGIPTAITQNVEDMMKSEEARTIINTSSIVVILGQTAMNRQQLSDMLNISTEEQRYINAAKPGMGLLWIENEIIPLNDSFPKDTKLYKLMTTKPSET
ncbi:hypothetical protein LKD70_09095 [Ruminococcus sp. CLA-AA-H200]|uniref:TraG P-loop domain-containing protein n=1 Tax=Ruminococcus turbiniformis TaxID=2881258 RepID=A0ABS8FX04_9FIRM|nr:hypothetical protein [Ruminococcus turbiniformis]MCC2254570.1 hypothetical protein [Ruminococcus turbiniformis]